MIHVVKYVPAWFPGAGFKRLAQKTKELTRKMVDQPFNTVKYQVVSCPADQPGACANGH